MQNLSRNSLTMSNASFVCAESMSYEYKWKRQIGTACATTLPAEKLCRSNHSSEAVASVEHAYNSIIIRYEYI